MEVEKVDDGAQPHAVDHVADRAAEYQARAKQNRRLLQDACARSHDPHRRDHRDGDEELALPARALDRKLKAAPLL